MVLAVVRSISSRMMMMHLSNKHKCSPSGLNANDHDVISVTWPSPQPPEPGGALVRHRGVASKTFYNISCLCKKISTTTKTQNDHTRVFVSGKIIVDRHCCERKGSKTGPEMAPCTITEPLSLVHFDMIAIMCLLPTTTTTMVIYCDCDLECPHTAWTRFRRSHSLQLKA